MQLSFYEIFIIATYSFKEIFKSKVMLNVIIILFAQVLISYIASEFTYGVPQKVVLDFGLGVTSISALAISVFIGVGLISKEIESRTVYMILSRPVSRLSFLVGKSLGFSAILFCNVAILGLGAISTYMFLGGEFNSLLVWAPFFSFLESLILLQIVIFFSLITNNILSVIFSISVYIVGAVFSSTLLVSFTQKDPITFSLVKLSSFFLPNISKFNIKDFVIYKQTLPIDYLFSTAFYGIFYFLILLTISSIIFQKKNLD